MRILTCTHQRALLIAFTTVVLTSCFNGGHRVAEDAGPPQCAVGFADCNGDDSDECEAELATDLAHCGSCGTVCGDNQICSTVGCIDDPVLISGQAAPVALAVDATHVYWLNSGVLDALQNPGTGALVRLALAGGAPEILVAEIASPVSLIVDDTHAYWGRDSASGLWKVSKDGTGVPAQIAQGVTPSHLAQTATHLFWADQSTSSVMRIAKDGTGLGTVATQTPFVEALAVDDSFIYFTSEDRLYQAPADGSGSAEILVGSSASNFVRLATDEVYWTTNRTSDEVRVQKRSRDDGTITNLAIEGGCNDRGLVVDSSNVYFAFSSDNCSAPDKIVKAPRQPGESSVLIDNLDSVEGLGMDDSHLYWITRGESDVATGVVYRFAK